MLKADQINSNTVDSPENYGGSDERETAATAPTITNLVCFLVYEYEWQQKQEIKQLIAKQKQTCSN